MNGPSVRDLHLAQQAAIPPADLWAADGDIVVKPTPEQLATISGRGRTTLPDTTLDPRYGPIVDDTDDDVFMWGAV